MIRHWRGELPLVWAFWLVLVGLLAILFGLQEWLSPAEDHDFSNWFWPVLAWALFAHVLILIWQITGVLRSAERHFHETGSQATVWGVQICSVLAVFLSATYLLQAWQETRPVAARENIFEQAEAERASRYDIRIIPNFLAIEFTGDIELGATRRLRGILASGPPFRLVIFHSDGGNIFEARGLARAIRDHGLDTHVDQLCASACTSAFLGGKKRTISPGARLGFHQYKIAAGYSVLGSDTTKEQDRDRNAFAVSGVSAGFLEKVFDQPPTGMWFPTTEELLEAGVVHEMLN